MSEPDDAQKLERRLEKLEDRVRDLERKLARRKGAGKSGKSTAEGSKRKVPAGERLAGRFSTGEEWLNRIGIALLLLGLAFLFKYSVDQGWLIPPVRSAVGLSAGGLLLFSGFRLGEESTLRPLLLGGGIAAFYLTGFATHYLYDFVSAVWMWMFMAGVTGTALLLSLPRDEAVLSVVGIAGGFGTPFMLQNGAAGIPVLIGYTLLLLATSSAIYWRKGWRSMVWISAAGTWIVLFSSAGYAMGLYPAEAGSVRLYLQVATVAVFGALWGVPLLFELKKRGTAGGPGEERPSGYSPTRRLHMAGYAIVIPLLTFNFLPVAWEISSQGLGWLGLLFAGMGALLYFRMRAGGYLKPASMHGFAALLLAGEAFFLLMDSPWIFLALTVEAVALRFLGRRMEDELLRLGSHLVFLVLLVWLLSGMSGDVAATVPFLGPDAVIRLAAILAAGLLVPLWQENRSSRNFYRAGAHLLLLGWLYNECMLLDDGQAYATLSWGLYAGVLLIGGFARDAAWLRLGGMATVFLLVGKLVLFDLSQLPAIWRILLFMGLGSAFLMIGYYWRGKWRRE